MEELGFKKYMEKTYDEPLLSSDIIPPTRSTKIFMGCRRVNEKEYIVGVIADSKIMSTQTHSSTDATFENGFYYYLIPGKSVGFAPNQHVKVNGPDTFGCHMKNGKFDCSAPDRLSWTLNASSVGGWRCGTFGALHNDKTFIKELWFL